MVEIHDDVLGTLGDTPLVALRRYCPGAAQLVAKIESRNPGQSVKDRIGIAMIERAEREGQLRPGQWIVEPTSGNTGLGLAIAAVLRGYRLVCTAADKIPREKVALLQAFGVEVITCPTNVPPEDPRSYYRVAERIRDERGAFLPNQYRNSANPQAHFDSTGPEIWRQTDGTITHFVAGVGTGGTISGVGRYLKRQNAAVHVLGADPDGSVYAHYARHRRVPESAEIHGYLIDGIGQSYVPDTVWWDAIDDVVTVSDRDAYRAVFELAQSEGILTGSSGGAAVVAARRLAASLPASALVVTLLPDSGERYLSKLNTAWMSEQGLL